MCVSYDYLARFSVGDIFTIEGHLITGWQKWYWRLRNLRWSRLPLQTYKVLAVTAACVTFEEVHG